MTRRRLSFRVDLTPPPIEPTPWPRATLCIVLITALSWVGCVGVAWTLAVVIRLIQWAYA